jgi:hypothetical protein
LAAGVPAWVKKKRGRKEVSITESKEAAHGFRPLSEIIISGNFEQQITQLKTKCDLFVKIHILTL